MTLPLKREDILAWRSRAAVPPPFLMPGFIPTGEVTLLTGREGKSTGGQQTATAYAAGKPLFGIDLARPPLGDDIQAWLGADRPRGGPAVYVTAEDGPEHLHWVQQHQAAALGVSYDDLAHNLSLVSVRGYLHNELATFDHRGVLTRTAACDRLERTLDEFEPELLILDNVAHFFSGNENDRREVTSFINLLYALARPYGTTVVLIGHPNKEGDSYSGSTAWRNAVRSHISIMPPEKSADPSERVLRVEKANYGQPGLEMRLHWHDFALYRPEDLPAEADRSTGRERAEDSAFLRCLEQVTAEQRAVSHHRGTNYAPKVFAAMPAGKGFKEPAYERAMNRLFGAGAIVADELLPFRRRSTRHAVYGLAVASTPLRRPPASTRVDPTENCEKSACVHPPLSYGETGGSLEAAPPAPSEGQR